MNKLFRNFCGSINYNTYNNIEAALFATGISSSIVNTVMLLNDIETFGLLGSVSALSNLIYVYFCISNGEYHTKDINEVKKIYFEFIHNYNKMNKDFGFKEPISIYAMFYWLYVNGYLSNNKNFVFSNDKCYNLRYLYGTDVINGAAVCRHISSMLTDILNDNDIKAINIACCAPPVDLGVDQVDFEEYSREKNIDMIYRFVRSDDERKSLIDKIVFLESEEIYLNVYLRCMDLVCDNKKKMAAVNHMITYALYNDKSYYLDPTQARIYRFKENSNGELYDEYCDGIVIKKNSFWKLNDRENKDVRELEKKVFMENDSISLEEEKRIVLATLDICKNNMDVFERFYSDNRELYDEISNKLVRIKKR